MSFNLGHLIGYKGLPTLDDVTHLLDQLHECHILAILFEKTLSFYTISCGVICVDAFSNLRGEEK